jgi:hypothetical protein
MSSFPRPVLAALAAIGMMGALVGASTLPANAASIASCHEDKIELSNGGRVSRIDLFADEIAMELRQRGYDVESVQDWGGCIRAFMNNAHGRMEYFDPDTLEPLTR